MRRLYRVALFLALIVPCAAQAATLTQIVGDVSVDTGAGPKPAHSAVTLKTGDVVKVGPNGSAQIVYSNGCVTTVEAAKESQTVVIPDPEPGCVSPALITAGVVGLGALTVVVLTNQDEDNPVSP